MEAVSQGAIEAGEAAAGFKIYREGGRWVGLVRPSAFHPPYPETVHLSRARRNGATSDSSPGSFIVHAVSGCVYRSWGRMGAGSILTYLSRTM